MLKTLSHEVDFFSKLHHPNVKIVLGACLDPGNVMLVLEFLDKDSLRDFLRSRDAEAVLTFQKCVKFGVDVARGMRYLHGRCKIVQGDLQSRNLLLDSSYNVKICVCGLGRAGVAAAADPPVATASVAAQAVASAAVSASAVAR